MTVLQVVPGINLAKLQQAAVAREARQITWQDAERIGQDLAAVVCKYAPGTDGELLAKQITSDVVEWAHQNGLYKSGLAPRGKR